MWIATALACAASLGPLARAQDGWNGRLPGDEGPLENGTFLPTDEAAAEELARGDRALARLRRETLDDPALRTAAWREVFDAWREALAVGAPDAAVPGRLFDEDDEAAALWPDPDGSAGRRVDGLEAAVLGRLAALTAAERSRWRERFGDLGDEARAQAGRGEPALAGVEREFPATAAAFAAALTLADRAFERGAPSAAATWVDRARVHAELCGAGALPDGAGAALERRRGALAAWLDRDRRPPGRWERATRLREEHVLPLRTIRGRAVDGFVGVRPGLCGLADGSVALQSPLALHLFHPDRVPRTDLRLDPSRTIEIAALVGENAEHVAVPYAAPGPPGWPLRPVLVDPTGRDLVLVHGRLSSSGANVVLRVRLPGDPDLDQSPVARLIWATSATWRIDADGAVHAVDLGAPNLELHAAPAIVGDVVCLQARERPLPAAFAPTQGPLSEVRAHAIALDLETGEPRWQRFLAMGTELFRGVGRSRQSIGPWAAQPVVAAGGRAFLGTHLGVGSLVDAADGRLHWSLLSRRRAAEDDGWIGRRPVFARDAIVWTPGDGDRLYWLDPTAGLGRPKILGVRAVGEGLALVGGDRDRAVVLARAGARPALSTWERTSGRRSDALYLEPLEKVAGALTSPARTFVATDRGLYLFDRERDDLLLSVYPYEPGSGGGGAVFGHQDRVFVVGHDLVRIVATD